MINTLADWAAALVVFLIAILFSGCAIFSDGANVDYSRFLNIPLTVGFISGDAPYEADPGSKTHKNFQGNEPWSTWSHGNAEFRNYRSTEGPWKHSVVTCRTLSGIKFCN